MAFITTASVLRRVRLECRRRRARRDHSWRRCARQYRTTLSHTAVHTVAHAHSNWAGDTHARAHWLLPQQLNRAACARVFWWACLPPFSQGIYQLELYYGLALMPGVADLKIHYASMYDL
jgi:hypothetical protein